MRPKVKCKSCEREQILYILHAGSYPERCAFCGSKFIDIEFIPKEEIHNEEMRIAHERINK